MALFKIADETKKLEELDEIGFKNEREMQETTENNLQDILGLDFVCREFSVKDSRIDTLAFNEEMKSFIIIEYKIRKNSSVVDQGMNYLSLMLENRAEFVLEYNRIKEAKMDKRSVDWSQSKVIFISHTFTRQQKGATNFMDFPVDMWEIKKYKNNLVDYKQVEKSATQASIKELLGKEKKMATKEKSDEKTAGDVINEIKIYIEEDHFDAGNIDLADLYEEFRFGILNLDESITMKVNKHYIAFATNFNIVCIKIQRNQLRLLLNIPKGKLNDPMAIAEDVSGRHGTGDYRIYVKSNENLEYILSLIRQSLEYKGKRR